MSRFKKYILIMLAMLLSAIIAAVVVWYFLVVEPIREAQENIDSSFEKAEQFGESIIDKTEEKLQEQGVDTNNLKDDISDSVESIKTNTQIVIQKSNLPEAQQSILTTFGFGENIVITPEMQACAEAKLGAERLAEIVAGATPSFMEASSLVVCLRN